MSRIRFFWYVTKINLRWNVVQSWIIDIYEFYGLWYNQYKSYEGAKRSPPYHKPLDLMMDLYDGQKINLKTRVDIWIRMDMIAVE